MKAYKILYADNDPDALKLTSQFLTKLGYIVEVADNPTSTIEKLKTQIFDLAILDLRLEDNDDVNDQSGLDIAKTEARSTPKLIYTAFPKFAHAKEALLMDRHELPPAVDYLDKGIDLPGLKDAIENTISKYIQAQNDVTLTWLASEVNSVNQLATLLDSNQEIVDFPQLANELGIVIRQLFAQYEEISISRLLWSEKFRCCLAVHAYHHDIEDQYLLTLGPRDSIHKEINIFRATVSMTQSVNSLSLYSQKDSLHMAAILWSIKGVDIDITKSAKDLILNGTEKQIQSIISRLFSSIQSTWYQQGYAKTKISKFTPKSFWGFVNTGSSDANRGSLQQKFESIAELSYSRNIFPIRVNNKAIEIERPGGKIEILPNPLNIIFDEHGFPSTGLLTTTIAGLTNLDRILIDEKEQFWLTDYSKIRTSVVSADFAALENHVRFTLTELSDVFTALDFEEQLLGMTSLAENLSGRNVIPSHRNILQAILSIRNSAAKVFGNQILLYYLTLLFIAAKGLVDQPAQLHFSKRQLISYVYRILFMAKISDYIVKNHGNTRFAKDKKGLDRWKIILDEGQRRVWVGETEKQLSHTEFEILLFMYKKNGEVCKREEILEKVLKYSGGLDKSAKNLINTHINRIRNQVEPDPEKPIFVLTVRNEGYRLDLST